MNAKQQEQGFVLVNSQVQCLRGALGRTWLHIGQSLVRIQLYLLCFGFCFHENIPISGPGTFPEPGLEAGGGSQFPFVDVAFQSCQELMGWAQLPAVSQ